MRRSTIIGLTLSTLGVVGLSVSAAAMASRLSHRNLGVVWFGQPFSDPKFKYADLPVEIETLDPDASGSQARLRIAWRGESLIFDLEPGMRDDPRLPGLLRHDDWLRVLVMAQGERDEQELERAIERGEINPRLIISMRLPAKDFEPGSWGAVRRKEWRYRFVELLPPSVSPDRAFEVIESTYAELDRLGDPVYRAANQREGEAWKYYAMQHVTPPTLVRAKSRPIAGAMEAMGWTWPASAASIVLIVSGLATLGLASINRDH